jgi:iron complex transport system substrate-binding protein
MKKKLILMMIGAMTVGVLLTGCGKKEEMPVQETMVEQEEAFTFTDDLGREITVNNPQRVAALLGSYADIWYLAGGEVHACADDAWDDFNLPMPEDAVNLGMTKDLNLEKLFGADPDLELASVNTRQNMEWLDLFEESGINAAYFDVSDFDDYLRVLEICTKITDREDLYEQNGLAIQQKIEDVKAASQARIAEEGKAPTALVIRASASIICAKNSTGNVLGEMVAGVGCVNIADSNDSLLETLSMEYIIEQDPEYIFFTQHGDDKEKVEANIQNFITENPAWSELTAVKEGRVYMMEKDLYTLKPNDRWGEAYEKLEAILAGETK